MIEIPVKRALVDPAAFRGVRPSTDGLAELPVGSVVRAPDGTPLLAYVQLWHKGDPTLERLRIGLARIKFPTTVGVSRATRVNGLPVRSVQFGYLPATVLRRDFCKLARIDTDHPELARLLYRAGIDLERRYEAMAPAIYARHLANAARVLPDWKLPLGQCFTGGTINGNSAIGYHYDRGNFAATFSAMPVIRDGMAGGELVVPELGYYLPAADGTCVFFDGQSLLHGVTPLEKVKRTGHRYSIVYYSASKLWNCLPPAAEVERAQARRTDREYRRTHREQTRV